MKRLTSLTIFLGAFLVFGVQPLVGRTLLPLFGGTASVWVTCLASFQILLLAGYFYAHLLVGRQSSDASTEPSRRRGALWIHVFLVIAAASWLTFVAFNYRSLITWATRLEAPALGALLAVCVLVAIPYLLLSANSSLVQVLAGGQYRLYAVSNAGSFTGLLAYPLVFEPFLSLRMQWIVLAGCCFVYGGLLPLLVLHRHSANSISTNDNDRDASPKDIDEEQGSDFSVQSLWLLLPGATCFLLDAVTTHLTSNVTPIPLMWVLLLGLFLLSYVIGFSKAGERLLLFWLPVSFAFVLLAAWAMGAGKDTAEQFRWNIAIVPLMLFFACTALHTFLYRIRPHVHLLTRYYLFIALGGAVGGVLASLVSPLVFTRVREYPLSLILMAASIAIAPFCLWRKRVLSFQHSRKIALAAVVLVAIVSFWIELKICRNVLAEGRSFYGAWRVGKERIFNQYGKHYDLYVFNHGGTSHGLQAVDEAYRDEPTAYYGKGTAGLAFDLARNFATNTPIRASIVGLGVGTMAIYGRSGDYIRFYEICQQVAEVAKSPNWFDFIRRGNGEVDIVVADARKALEREQMKNEERYDLLVVDAYSGDSIPMHLITSEAFDLYRERLKDDGVLALHISNWNIDLLPLVKAAAKHLDMNVDVVVTQPGLFTIEADWTYISKRKLKFPDGTYRLNMPEVDDVDLPTDDKGSMLPFVNFAFK